MTEAPSEAEPDEGDFPASDARRVAAYAAGLGVDRETVAQICRGVAAEAAAMPEPPDDHARLVEVRRRLMLAAG